MWEVPYFQKKGEYPTSEDTGGLREESEQIGFAKFITIDWTLYALQLLLHDGPSFIKPNHKNKQVYLSSFPNASVSHKTDIK